MTPTIEKPTPAEYASFYEPYIASLPEGNILDLMRAQKQDVSRLPNVVSRDRETFAYAPGKWTIRQVVGHLCDAERIIVGHAQHHLDLLRDRYQVHSEQSSID